MSMLRAGCPTVVYWLANCTLMRGGISFCSNIHKWKCILINSLAHQGHSECCYKLDAVVGFLNNVRDMACIPRLVECEFAI